MLVVGVGEMVGSSQQGEACLEQVGLEGGGPLVWFAVLEFSAYEGEPLGVAHGGLWVGIARWSG